MKTSELMIGDYVLVKPSKMIIKIVAIHHNKVAYHSYVNRLIWVEEGLLEPIILTPRILEKNGFYYGYTSREEDAASNTITSLSETDKGWCWDEGSGAIKIMFPDEADGGLVEIDDQSFNRYLSFVFCDNLYVHELQHILKTCGIEKEIIL